MIDDKHLPIGDPVSMIYDTIENPALNQFHTVFSPAQALSWPMESKSTFQIIRLLIQTDFRCGGRCERALHLHNIHSHSSYRVFD